MQWNTHAKHIPLHIESMFEIFDQIKLYASLEPIGLVVIVHCPERDKMIEHRLKHAA